MGTRTDIDGPAALSSDSYLARNHLGEPVDFLCVGFEIV